MQMRDSRCEAQAETGTGLRAALLEPGSGLGLSLASAVAHLHGGELKLEDNEPGLKASLVLPRGGPQLPQPTE